MVTLLYRIHWDFFSNAHSCLIQPRRMNIQDTSHRFAIMRKAIPVNTVKMHLLRFIKCNTLIVDIFTEMYGSVDAIKDTIQKKLIKTFSMGLLPTIDFFRDIME